MSLVRSVGPQRRHFIAALAQVTGVCAWLVVAVWGASQLMTRNLHVFGESKVDIANMTTMKFANEAYPQWLVDHPAAQCPPMLAALSPYLDQRDTKDPWGNDYVMTCSPATGPVIVSSAGEDGVFGTCDDVRSDVDRRR